jgi:hypothetical protein
MLDQPHNAEILIKAKCALQAIPFHLIYKKKKVLFSTISRSLQNEHNILENAIRMRDQVLRESELSLQSSIDIIDNHIQSWRS